MRSRGLFDPARSGRSAPGAPAGGGERPLTVTQLTAQVRVTIENRFDRVCVEGELSNVKRYGSGHCYFTLKDAQAQLSCVMWRNSVERLRFGPSDGMQVVARGRLSVYEPRGQYQLVVDRLELAGQGALAAAFERLKAKLAAEGLFAPERKRPLPPLPRKIGLVTSPSGAALRDLLKVILARWPRVELVLVPVRVQGESAAAEIARAIADLNRLGGVEVLVVGRGGGSLEDLWAFNEEVVARAIAASSVPVISAVGHETDFSIADFVADCRAATPSHAGELVVPVLADLETNLDCLGQGLPLALTARLRLARQQVAALASSWVFRTPEQRIQLLRQRLDDCQVRLGLRLQQRLGSLRERLARASGRIESLSPLAILARGYSVTSRASDGRLVLDPAELAPGELLLTRVHKGRVRSRVDPPA